jgi:hypothetical protein
MTDAPMPFYSTTDLAARWGVRPATVRWRVVFMRQQLAQPPLPEQVTRGPHGQRRYRADYVAALEAAFKGAP